MKRNIFLQEVTSGKNYTITPPCIIGRGKEADLLLGDPAVSHRHALIGERDGLIWIEDLKSANGVFVNGQKVDEKILLKPGDTIRLGQTELLFAPQEEDIAAQTVILHSLSPETKLNLDHQRLGLIYEITTELSANQDVTVLGEKIFSRFTEIFGQDRGYIALFQHDGSLKPVFSDSAMKAVPVSRSIVNRMFQNGESFLLEDALSEDAFKEQESILALRIRSALCVPLIFHNQIYGLMYLDKGVPGAYKQDDLEFLRSIASILAPLIENARLWTDLKRHYDNAVETLKITETRLIDMERKAAYVRLALAMAHEIRNPLMVVGGLLRRMAKSSDISGGEKFQTVMSSIDRIEMVLREVDSFVRMPEPRKTLVKIDQLIREEMEGYQSECAQRAICPRFIVNTSNLMVPLDGALFKKAFSMLFREIMVSMQQGSELRVTVCDCGNEAEIVIGDMKDSINLCEPNDAALQDKPWSLSLFLSIAHKILSDHGGKLLLNPALHLSLPLIIRIPRTATI